MPDVVEIFFRKGGENQNFKKIVANVTDCVKCIDGDSNLDSDLLKKLLERDNTYSPKNEIPIFAKTGHKIDIYNKPKKIAIEIEKSEVKYVWKLMCKFSIGSRKGLIDYAILVVPVKYRGRGSMKKSSDIFAQSKKISNFMSDILWTRNLAIIGYKKH